jgi:Rps23 Pro-64 3,4-dihydroxylase Tpa1-like proline 4-hydroxylase
MILMHHEIKKLPIVVIDQLYSDIECEKILQELLFLNSFPENLKDADGTGTAIDGTGEILKQTKGIFIDDIYKLRNFSNILTLNRKIFELKFVEMLSEISTIFNYINLSNFDTTLVQYYENSDFYKSHWDTSVISVISWFYQQPKAFLGGNLVFENSVSIECKFNRTVIFPSILNHAVETVTLDKSLLNQNLGRFSVSQFISINS